MRPNSSRRAAGVLAVLAIAAATFAAATFAAIDPAAATGHGSADAGDPNDDVHAYGVASFGDTRSFEPAAPTVAIAASPDGEGYWLAGADGGVFNFGSATFEGSLGDITLDQPIVAMAANPTGGFWLVASDGGVFAFGNAPFYGSLGGLILDQPIVGMAAHPSGRGYWLVAADGGVFTFGEAEFLGSMGGTRLNRPVVAMAAHPSGNGYWLTASDGGIFTFGEAGFHGSTGAMTLDRPIVAMAATPSSAGYWLVAEDGGLFTFGDAPFRGSAAGVQRNERIVGMAIPPEGGGYWLARRAGPTWPLTGMPADAIDQRPALAVKIDNSPAARGQWGLAQADIIFEELVEGGVTRLIGVFHSQGASEVGPIRSARETDVALLPMFGRTLLVYSGGNRTVRSIVNDSELVEGILPDTEHYGAYFRTRARRSPSNLLSRTSSLWPYATAEMGAPPRVFSFREPASRTNLLAPLPSASGFLGQGERFVIDFGNNTVAWTWNGARFERSHGTRAHRDANLNRVTAANVVILETPYLESKATGSPFTTALGQGEGRVLVDGALLAVTWSRGSFTDAFDLRHADTGVPVLLAPGNTWVELVPAGLAPFNG